MLPLLPHYNNNITCRRLQAALEATPAYLCAAAAVAVYFLCQGPDVFGCNSNVSFGVMCLNFTRLRHLSFNWTPVRLLQQRRRCKPCYICYWIQQEHNISMWWFLRCSPRCNRRHFLCISLMHCVTDSEALFPGAVPRNLKISVARHRLLQKLALVAAARCPKANGNSWSSG